MMKEMDDEEALNFFEDEDQIDSENDSPERLETRQLNAWTSLVLGIVGSLGWLVPIIGLPVTIVGTVFGAIGIKTKKSRGIAIAGFVINTVFLTATIAKGILDIIKYLKKSSKY